MKKIKIFLLASIGLFALNSCETTDLDQTVNPNNLSPDKADVEFLLNSSFIQFARATQRYGEFGSELTRIDYMFGGGGSYLTAFNDVTFSTVWRQTYVQVYSDLKLMTPLAEEAGLSNHIGMGKVMQASLMLTTVDMFGDVPFSEALDPSNLAPKLDSGADVYAAAIALLDQAIGHFNEGVTIGSNYEPFYGNNFTNWIKLANSLKMKAYIQTRLVDNTAISKFEQIVSSGNYITQNSENFVWNWSTENINPQSRHPSYVENYQATGASGYRSNWLMDYMNNDKSIADPRIRYYFYRQRNALPTNPTQQFQAIRCLVEPVPPHYTAAGVTYCFPGQDPSITSPPYNLADSQGYWGRDHGNREGLGPDNRLKTAAGIYPAGGRFDDNSFQGINGIDRGAFGAGITPILLSSTVDFWRAEAALNGGSGDAATHIANGISKSISYVRTFDSRYADTSRPINVDFIPAAGDDATYIAEATAAFNTASGAAKLDVLAKEFFVSLYGNGIDAYNFYRRTGAPSDIQLHINPSPGGFVRSNLYPASEANNNPNVPQKPGVTQRVFWDTNPETGFPQNN